ERAPVQIRLLASQIAGDGLQQARALAADAGDVGEDVARLDLTQDRDVGDGADAEVPEVRAAHGKRWPAGRHADDVGERQAAIEQLAHRVQQVEGGALDGDDVHVAGDEVRREIVFERRLRTLLPAGTHAMRDVEQHAALAGRPDRRTGPPV